MRELLERLQSDVTESAYGDSIAVSLKELPDALRKALKKIGYRRRDIDVQAKDAVSVQSYAGKGERGFAIAVNLSTGKVSDVSTGAWGGASVYDQKPLDWVDKPVRIPSDGAIITGVTGGHGTFAHVYVHPKSLVPMLPGDEDITDRDREILAMATYLSSYKKELFQRYRVTDSEIDDLVRKGYMKKNKRGATSLTTKGKNAKSSKSY